MKSNAVNPIRQEITKVKDLNDFGPVITTPTLFKSSLLFQTKEFFNNSTLHGVRYIAETGRPFGEKFMWFCFTSIGAVAALIIIFSLWEKFQTNPTITGLDTDFHNQQVVFPAVAICPEKPYNEEKIKEYAYKIGYDEGSEKYEPFLKILTQLSYKNFDKLYKASLNFTEDWKTIDGKPLRKYAFEVALECDEVFESCKYKDEEMECCKYFFPIYMEHGFCYAFNARYKDNADYDEKNDVINDVFETDKKWALVAKIRNRSSVFIHSFEESSGWDYRPHFIWDELEAVDILISMKQTYTTIDARQLSIGQRKCIFPDEKKLKFYEGDYTFTGCMRECRMQKALKYCKCVPPFYRPSKDYAFCNINNFKCLSQYAANITNIKGCNECELSCHNTVYDIEKLSKLSTGVDGTSDKSEAAITIEYLTWPIVRYKREVLFGWVDLLVSFGGIAGLFLGFSLLSGVEIVYYFTMRACCMLYKNRDELYKVEAEKLQKPPERVYLSLKPNFNRRRRSASLPPTIIKVEENPFVNKVNIVRAGTKFTKNTNNKMYNNKNNYLNNYNSYNNTNNNLNVTLNNSNVNDLKSLRKADYKLNYIKPNFKVGQFTPYDIYATNNKRSSSLQNFTYMP